MIRISIIAIALLAASSCAAPEADRDASAGAASVADATPTPDAAATVAPDAGTLSPVTTLAGEWRVAGVDGQPLDETYGLALSATDRVIRFEPGCAGRDRAYAIDGSRFRTWLSEDDPQQAICEIGLPPRLQDVWRAIDAADRIARMPSNAVLIAGGGHSVTLFSQ